MSQLKKLGFIAVPLGSSSKEKAKELRPAAELAGSLAGGAVGSVVGAGAGVGLANMADDGQLRFLGVRRNPGGF